MDFDLPLQLILALVLGGVIGLEREINEKKVSLPHAQPTAIAGLRSFALISLLGGLTGVMLAVGLMPFALVFSSAILLLIVAFYVMDSRGSSDTGFTTELALMMTFLLGALLTLDVLPVQLILASTVVLIVLLSQKKQIKNAVHDVQLREINAFIGYAVIAVVILPFLPNETYALSDIPYFNNLLQSFQTDLRGLASIEFINPFNLWLIVAFITGVDIAGYILERTIGQKKGWLLTSAIGGFISSTAVTFRLAQQSKQVKNADHLVSAALISNLSSFIKLAVLIAGINALLFLKLTPIFLVIIVIGFAASIYFLQALKRKHDISFEEADYQREIFNFIPALKFASLFLTISILTKIALLYFGGSGFLISSALGGLIGVDVVMINASDLTGNTISVSLATWTFILVNAVNLATKTIYSLLQGSREFTAKFGVSVALIITASVVSALLF